MLEVIQDFIKKQQIIFTCNLITALLNGNNINDCACNQMIHQGAKCARCPLYAHSYCYREIGFWLK